MQSLEKITEDVKEQEKIESIARFVTQGVVLFFKAFPEALPPTNSFLKELAIKNKEGER